MLKKFLDPKTDIAFKRIFGSEKNKDILIDFLNDVLERQGDEWIVDLEYLNPIQEPEIGLSKVSVVDILCRDKAGIKYIVEMQVAKTQGFEKRAQYYAAKAYCSQMKEGGKYSDLKEVIFLAILDYTMFPNKSTYKSDHVLLDKETYEQDLKGFSFTFVELEKFNKSLEDCTTGLDKWLYFLIHANSSDTAEVAMYHDHLIERAYEELNKNYWSEEELETYEAAQKQIMDARAILDNARDEGLAEGRAEGRAEGLAEGIAEGLEKGMVEGIATIIRAMYTNGISTEAISKATNLSITEIQRHL